MPEAAAVLLTGGTGFVGEAILRRLVADGRHVRALTRSDASRATLRTAGAEPVGGDILDPSSLASAMAGCDVVFHVAGLNGFCLPDPGRLRRVNVDGTRNVLQAAAAAGVRRIVYTSSAATIGEAHGTVGREDSPHRGTFLSAYEQSKYRAEREALRLAEAAGIELVCVNPSSVQGPGRTRGTAKLLLGYVNGTLRALIDSRMSVVDIGDCVEAHLRAEQFGAPGQRYLISGAALTVREAVALMGAIAGLDEHPRYLSPRVAMAMATVVGAGGRVARRRAPFCREMMRTLLHGHTYDGERAVRELGLAYTPIEETLCRTLTWYREQGLITRPLPNLPGPAGTPS